jgi:hypothetical protein
MLTIRHQITIPSELTVTSPGPTTVQTVPVTTQITSTAAPVTTSAPLQVSEGAAATNKPIAYAVAGGMALLAALA